MELAAKTSYENGFVLLHEFRKRLVYNLRTLLMAVVPDIRKEKELCARNGFGKLTAQGLALIHSLNGFRLTIAARAAQNYRPRIDV